MFVLVYCFGFSLQEVHTFTYTHSYSRFKKSTSKGANYPTVGLISISVLLIKLKLSSIPLYNSECIKVLLSFES